MDKENKDRSTSVVSLSEMTVLGLAKVAACVPEVTVGDIMTNSENIINLAEKAYRAGAILAVFPELSLTGYTCADLFSQSLLLEKVADGLMSICLASRRGHIPTVIVGAPLMWNGNLYNCAVVISGGVVKGVVPKSHIPNYAEFYEKRWFSSGADVRGAFISLSTFGANEYMDYPSFMSSVPFGTDLIFDFKFLKVGIEICEDLWVPVPPSCNLCRRGADVILNLSASDDNIGKREYVRSLVSQQSARCRSAYLYASAGWGESSTDLSFTGNALVASDGKISSETDGFIVGDSMASAVIDVELLRAERAKFNTFYDDVSSLPSVRFVDCSASFQHHQQDTRTVSMRVDPFPFVPSGTNNLNERCKEISSIQAWGLMQRLHSTGCNKAVIGISGGLDSTLALLVTVDTFDRLDIPRENIVAVTMPGFGTTDRTHDNAWNLMGELGVTRMEIPIGDSVRLHFHDIGHDENIHDATYENGQARERTQILMDLANKNGGMVIGTGDLSELALGWCTYNGDQMSMYGVNASVPKTLVRYLVGWHASKGSERVQSLLNDIIDTPISPELVPANPDGSIVQKTEDLVGPYDLHDFFLYHTIRNGFTPAKVFFLAKIAFYGRFSHKVILKWMRTFYHRFFSQQFKRSSMPDGPKVGSVCLSPRGDWRMPSDASSRMWLREVSLLEKSFLNEYSI